MLPSSRYKPSITTKIMLQQKKENYYTVFLMDIYVQVFSIKILVN